MKPSKLETYIEVLKVIALNDSLKASSIALELNIDAKELRGHLDFLLNQDLIGECKICSQGPKFLITQRGIAVLKHFKELKQKLPIIEEISVS